MLKTIASLAACASALIASAPAHAQAYPNKPIKIIVGFPPGGGLDFTTRLIAPHLAEALGQNVIVENKAGAAGVLAHIEVARAAPDGYTLIVGNIGPLALAPNMMDKRPYDPVKDFTPIGQVVATYFVAAVPANHLANSLKGFVEWARLNDGKVNFASGGNGSITHLNGELLNEVGKIRMTHVPYKGTAPAVTDLIAGQTHILIDIGSVLKPQVIGGRLKALAVTSPSRDPVLPDVPTATEAGFPSLETAGWQGHRPGGNARGRGAQTPWCVARRARQARRARTLRECRHAGDGARPAGLRRFHQGRERTLAAADQGVWREDRLVNQ